MAPAKRTLAVVDVPMLEWEPVAARCVAWLPMDEDDDEEWWWPAAEAIGDPAEDEADAMEGAAAEEEAPE